VSSRITVAYGNSEWTESVIRSLLLMRISLSSPILTPSWVTDSFSASQEGSLPWSQMLVTALLLKTELLVQFASFFFVGFILILSSHLRLGLKKCFPELVCVCVCVCVCCFLSPALPVSLAFITLSKVYKSLSYSWCSCLHSRGTSSSLGRSPLHSPLL
jgi:hypothetical protein